ncbi:MAG: IS5 family transposase [Candidatus Diapherotrites archaeon]|nr:IS5 family transposase [Candidatus Diapherotrites archaeon]
MVCITPNTKSKRDWKSVNNRLVKQGTLLVSLSFLDSWQEQVKQLNDGKVGRPYKYPTGLIDYAGLLHCFIHLPYRQAKGVLVAIAEKEPRLKAADYCTLCRRFNKLETKIQPRQQNSEEDLWVAIDASGVCITNRGEWMRKIHRKGKITESKGFLKIHVSVDVKTKEVVGLEITTDKVGDNGRFDALLQDSITNTNRPLKGIYADGGYDTFENFEKLEETGIFPGIRIDENAVTDPPPNRYPQRRRKEPARTKHARKQLQDRDTWKKETGYGLRWHSEGFFSVLKRRYGKHVMAKNFKNMQQELLFKAQLYNQLL